MIMVERMGICVLKEVGEKEKQKLLCAEPPSIVSTRANGLSTQQNQQDAASQPRSHSISELGSDFSCHHLGWHVNGIYTQACSGTNIHAARSARRAQWMVINLELWGPSKPHQSEKAKSYK